jgi:UDP-N-acetylglucosamine/UDP-N-acetylgalactosamine diphosphorylase
VRVVEYSELPPEQAQARLPSGGLAYDAANIAVHYFSLPFLAACCAPPGADGPRLRHHSALKKVPCLGDPSPAQPNALKLEAFVFDVYPSAPAERVALLEGVRSDDFAPVKNAEGAGRDSPVRPAQVPQSQVTAAHSPCVGAGHRAGDAERAAPALGCGGWGGGCGRRPV